jgi:hypothetical protein
MTQATRHDATRPVPHTLQHQLAAHFSEIAALHGAWMAVKFGRGLADALGRVEQDRRQATKTRSQT